MPREFFIGKNFGDKTIRVIALASNILEEYAAQGYDLTLRQLYYQLVARGLMNNTPRDYARLGRIVGDARLAGLIDWHMLVDRGRRTIYRSHWDSPAAIVRAAADSFRIDHWDNQPCHVEVMVEKDALSGVLSPVCRDLDVRFTANRGYSSLSHLYGVGKRIAYMIDQGKDVWIFYLGDHDPSGLDMDRDILERLEMFSGEHIELKRLALSMEQIEEMQPPENPAKMSDSRAQAYIAQFGNSSWELDAIEPRDLAQIVTQAVHELRDDDLYEETIEREAEMVAELEAFVESYEEE